MTAQPTTMIATPTAQRELIFFCPIPGHGRQTFIEEGNIPNHSSSIRITRYGHLACGCDITAITYTEGEVYAYCVGGGDYVTVWTVLCSGSNAAEAETAFRTADLSDLYPEDALYTVQDGDRYLVVATAPIEGMAPSNFIRWNPPMLRSYR